MTEEEINKKIQDIKNQLAKLEPSIKTFSEFAKKQFENMKGKFHHAKTKFEEKYDEKKRFDDGVCTYCCRSWRRFHRFG